MDVLSINQKDQGAVVEVTQDIPTIFRNTVKTFAVRDGDGLYHCCAKLLKAENTWEKIREKLIDHGGDHYGEVYAKNYLQRLWTLEECMLSHTIESVSWKTESPKKDDTLSIDWHHIYDNLDVLSTLAYVFQPLRPNNEPNFVDRFVRAYIKNGTISRIPPNTSDATADIFSSKFVELFANSTRSASKARGYIFATASQHSWYKPPQGAKNMDFADLFDDLHRQASQNGHVFTGRLTRSMTDKEASGDQEIACQASRRQPVPSCLGDLLKLFGQRTPLNPNGHQYHFTTGVGVSAVSGYSTSDAFQLIKKVMHFHCETWRKSRLGTELSRYGSNPETLGALMSYVGRWRG